MHRPGVILSTILALKETSRRHVKYAFNTGDWDIGYNYLVADDGKAYEGRGWGLEGAHTLGYNDIAVAICAIGNFEEEKPSQTLLQTIANLIACAEDEASIIIIITFIRTQDPQTCTY